MLFGCALAGLAAFVPRLVLILMWIFGPRINLAFDSFIVPLLGIIFLPCTTIMWVLVWSPVVGIVGWDWLWIAMGVLPDLMKWGQIESMRRGIPVYLQEAY